MNAVEILLAVKALLSSPEKRCVGAYARGGELGTMYSSKDPEADCWCLVGALRKVEPQTHLYHRYIARHLSAYDFLLRTAKEKGRTLEALSDDSTYEELMEWIDRAIELAKEKGNERDLSE